jgi:hypothetical protein
MWVMLALSVLSGCLDWCNQWTCGPKEAASCSSCAVCTGGQPAAGARPGGTACQTWCNEYTCDQPAECGGCAPCQPHPPPPPQRPNAFAHNPFIAAGGWYVNPTLKANLEATAASASGREAEVLHQMKEVPSAFWIDHASKIRGADRFDTLEGIVQDASRALPHPKLCVFILCTPSPCQGSTSLPVPLRPCATFPAATSAAYRRPPFGTRRRPPSLASHLIREVAHPSLASHLIREVAHRSLSASLPPHFPQTTSQTATATRRRATGRTTRT